MVSLLQRYSEGIVFLFFLIYLTIMVVYNSKPHIPERLVDLKSDKCSVTTLNELPVRPGELVWSDEFDSFNLTSWDQFTPAWGSHFQMNVNTPSNSYVHDGKLFLKPIYSAEWSGKAFTETQDFRQGVRANEKLDVMLEGIQPGEFFPIMAPLISTKTFFKFKYGRLQIRAKMPSGDWIEPIVSLAPAENYYGDDLGSGKIYFVNTRGNRKLYNSDGANVGSERNCPDLRYGHWPNIKVISQCLISEEGQGFDRDFHMYELEWTPKKIILKIDDEDVVIVPYPRPSMFKLWEKCQQTINPWRHAENKIMAPFDKSFYVEIGMLVGGVTGFFGDNLVNRPYPKPWQNSDANAVKVFWSARQLWEPTWETDGSAIQIDFIRLYSLNQTLSDMKGNAFH